MFSGTCVLIAADSTKLPFTCQTAPGPENHRIPTQRMRPDSRCGFPMIADFFNLPSLLEMFDQTRHAYLRLFYCYDMR
jgi:hypothetical protein